VCDIILAHEVFPVSWDASLVKEAMWKHILSSSIAMGTDPSFANESQPLGLWKLSGKKEASFH